ncbi:glycosyltransferase [Paenibacillus rigui]|uniref:Glycosyl transferase n=1 Tax=Paenibacillus rigui TaxID=554312 RepID=A0A229UQR5_9BACL|nr:glycosyltransferase [Paenibacillus rigui]OXM85219.1 glycosyl transferase [Paenibacillus rigui]
MKKNILFVMPSLTAGGGEKSLVNLLSHIDYEQYNVDLFLLNHEGIFMEFLPKEVRLLPLPESYHLFVLPLAKSILKLLAKGKVSLACNRLLFTLNNKLSSNRIRSEQHNWTYLAKSLEIIPKKYDVSIGFLEKTSTYFCVDKVEASKKIGWVHIDYDKLGMDPKLDIGYFRQLDHIVTVSEECAAILKNRFPDQQSKVEVIYNIVSPSMIHKMADQAERNVYNKREDEITILSIGRLHYQKGFELAIEACRQLVDRGYNIRWSIIGEGEEREKLERQIRELGLERYFHLLGLKSNPYPFIKQADIYAQPSRFEGKSIAIDEAKILNKPILVTNFSTAKDQIHDGVDGVIVDMNPTAVANGLEKLIQDRGLRKTLVSNLARLKLGTEAEIDKLYSLFASR